MIPSAFLTRCRHRWRHHCPFFQVLSPHTLLKTIVNIHILKLKSVEHCWLTCHIQIMKINMYIINQAVVKIYKTAKIVRKFRSKSSMKEMEQKVHERYEAKAPWMIWSRIKAQNNAYLYCLMYLILHSFRKGQHKKYKPVEQRKRKARWKLKIVSYH